MKRNSFSLSLIGLVGLTIAACGGSLTDVGEGSVAGLVVDTSGNPVRNASVFYNGTPSRTTASNSSGTYALLGVPARDVLVQATATVGSTSYVGSNVARIFDQEQANNCNITMIPVTQAATIRGTVFSNRGFRLKGARVSAKATAAGTYITSQAITDDNGNYEIRNLLGGSQFQVLVSNPGYTSADVNNIPAAGTSQTINFTLGTNSDPLIAAPSNLETFAYTSPDEVTRDAKAAKTYEAIWRQIDPHRKEKKAGSRLTALGSKVEIEMFWDAVDNLQLLGYNVYRRRGTNPWSKVDFVPDPLSNYYLDSNETLVDAATYWYAITAANTNFPDTNNSESDDSNIISVIPLGDMIVNTPRISGKNVTFDWQSVPNAGKYSFYFWTEYPTFNNNGFDNNAANPPTGTSWTYNLKPLVTGVRYYYVVVGATSDDAAKTISQVGSFIAP